MTLSEKIAWFLITTTCKILDHAWIVFDKELEIRDDGSPQGRPTYKYFMSCRRCGEYKEKTEDAYMGG